MESRGGLRAECGGFLEVSPSLSPCSQAPSLSKNIKIKNVAIENRHLQRGATDFSTETGEARKKQNDVFDALSQK